MEAGEGRGAASPCSRSSLGQGRREEQCAALQVLVADRAELSLLLQDRWDLGGGDADPGAAYPNLLAWGFVRAGFLVGFPLRARWVGNTARAALFLFCFTFFPLDVCVFPLPSLAKASSAKAQGPGTPRGRGKQSTLSPQGNGDRKQTRWRGASRRFCLPAPAAGQPSSGREVRALEAGVVAPAQRRVLRSGTGHRGRGEEGPRSGRTRGSTPSRSQLEDSGFSSLSPSPPARSPWSRLERQWGLKLHELKRLKLSKRSAGSKLSKHSGHLAGEVLFRLFIAVGAKRVQSWRQTFPKLGAVWSREGEREFSQARFQQTLTPSLRYVLLSVTW